MKKKVAKSKEPAWPMPRNVLFKPERSDYVRKVDRPVGCVFCTSANAPMAFETLCLLKTKYSQVVLNKYPYNSGHVLILPLRHSGDLLNLTDGERQDMFGLVSFVFQMLKDVYNPTGINMGMNHGASAGAGIPEHLHIHVIPRWAGDVNFFPLIADTKVVVENLESTYKKMRRYVKERFKESK